MSKKSLGLCIWNHEDATWKEKRLLKALNSDEVYRLQELLNRRKVMVKQIIGIVVLFLICLAMYLIYRKVGWL